MNVHLKKVRQQLAPRRDPYFRTLRKGCAIGYRKMSHDADGTWVARWADTTGKRHHRPLGNAASMDYSEAATLAAEWFTTLEQGESAASGQTVAAAFRSYAESQRLERNQGKRYSPTNTAVLRLLEETTLGRMRLDRITKTAVEHWRNSLMDGKRTAAGINRYMRTLKAALTAAEPDRARKPWQHVKPLRDERNAREVRLSLPQRRMLIEAAPADLANFLRALCFTGCRPGEAAELVVADLDVVNRQLKITHRKNPRGEPRSRWFPLTDEAFEFFKQRARSKLPAAPLLSRSDGRVWTSETWTRPLVELRRTLGLPAATVAYTFRHSTISDWLHQGGINPAVAAKLAGTSIAMIEASYLKRVPDIERELLAAVRVF